MALKQLMGGMMADRLLKVVWHWPYEVGSTYVLYSMNVDILGCLGLYHSHVTMSYILEATGIQMIIDFSIKEV